MWVACGRAGMYPFPTARPSQRGSPVPGEDGVLVDGAPTAGMGLYRLRHTVRAMLQDAVLVRARSSLRRD